MHCEKLLNTSFHTIHNTQDRNLSLSSPFSPFLSPSLPHLSYLSLYLPLPSLPLSHPPSLSLYLFFSFTYPTTACVSHLSLKRVDTMLTILFKMETRQDISFFKLCTVSTWSTKYINPPALKILCHGHYPGNYLHVLSVYSCDI